MQVPLVQIGQDAVDPTAGLPHAESVVGISDPTPTPATAWQKAIGRFVLQRRQRELLDVVGALRVRRAASRADCTAGNNSPIRMPMIVITTSNSTSVKPRRARRKAGRLSEIAVGCL